MKKSLKEKIVRELKTLKLKNFIVIFIAGVVNAFGITFFLFPVDLYDSGISGLSMLLDQVTPSWLTLSIFLIVLNIPIFLFGLKKEGLKFTIYSIFAVTVYSVMAFLITSGIIPIDVSASSPLAEKDLLLCSIFGGVLSGIGSGIVIRYGGALDGLDVLSVIFAKKLNLSIGTFSLICNVILYLACGIVKGSWILPLYSIVTYFVGSKTIDFIVDGIDKSKCVMIVTTKPDIIMEEIKKRFNTSCTLIESKGAVSNERRGMIYFVINCFQINRVREMIEDLDPMSFVSILDVTDVFKTSVREANANNEGSLAPASPEINADQGKDAK